MTTDPQTPVEELHREVGRIWLELADENTSRTLRRQAESCRKEAGLYNGLGGGRQASEALRDAERLERLADLCECAVRDE